MMFDQRQHGEIHEGKEASCGPCTPPMITPVSCCGKKPLGILYDDQDVQRDGQDEHDQHQPRIVEHPGKRVAGRSQIMPLKNLSLVR